MCILTREFGMHNLQGKLHFPDQMEMLMKPFSWNKERR